MAYLTKKKPRELTLCVQAPVDLVTLFVSSTQSHISAKGDCL